ncbi:hypothetical protein EDC04DRAFT_2564267 [Pisolithus marmoratus]|nr:hypothetical protein EDC04DRAFT_2564267 [Pisolithus marmoratus]
MNQSQYNDIQPKQFFRHWRLLLLSLIALLEVCAWITLGVYHLVTNKDDSRTAVFSIVIGTTWLYNFLKPIVRPRRNTYIDLFILYTTYLAFGVVRVGTSIYHYHLGTASPTTLAWMGMSLNVVAITAGLGILSIMPLKIPSDDLGEIYTVRSPEDYASIFEWATYSWIYPLIRSGNTREMKPEDVWDLTPAMQSKSIFAKFMAIQQLTLSRRLVMANFRDLLLDIFLTLITVLLSYAAPFFLHQILNLIEDPTREGRSKACVLALIAFICAVLKACRIADAQHLFFGRRASARVNAQLMNAIYNKALKRTGVTKQEPAPRTSPAVGLPNSDPPKLAAGGGKIVGLMAVDANRVSAIVASSYLLYGGLVEMALACTMLYSLLGSAAYAGIGLMFGAWAFHVCVARLQVRSQRELSASRDQRMSILYELTDAVRLIKFFSLERHWIERVQHARRVEISWLKRFRMKSVLSAIVSTAAPMLVSTISFFVYVDQGHQLTPSVAFTTVALMGMLRQPLNVFPNFLMQVLEACLNFDCLHMSKLTYGYLQSRLSLERIEAFLNEEDFSDCLSSPDGCSVEIGDGFAIDGGCFKWKEVSNENIDVLPQLNGGSTVQPPVSTRDETTTPLIAPGGNAPLGRNRFELRDIKVQFPAGKLSLITGPTGCGKTALLLALLGQMTMIKGKLVKPRDTSIAGGPPNLAAISYAAQTPWLHSGTIKENILFGYPYDERRYEDVVERCALCPDLNQLLDGDQTQVGDRGVNLSGGQKARIALARAVYAQTQYVLLDDPFSAIDTQTSRYLYERLFCGPLLEGRTVILVTHYIELVLPQANYIVCVQDGRIITQGYVGDLQAEGRLPYKPSASARKNHNVQIHQRISGQRVTEQIPDGTGGAAFSTRRTYLQMLLGRLWIPFAILILMSQVMGVVEKLWIREWGQAYRKRQEDPLVWYGLSENTFLHPVYNTYQQILTFPPDANDHPLLYVVLYAAIVFIMAVLGVASTILLYATALKGSRSLFSNLLERVVHASLPWHDTTPRGKESAPSAYVTHNRFGKDMQAIDVNLSNDVATVSSAFVNFVTAVFTIVLFLPIFVIPAIGIAFCCYFVGTRYLTVNRKLLRMESTSRSPIFSAFGELLDGIVTIQACKSTCRFLEEFHRKVDVANKMYYNSWMTNRWLLFNYDLLGAFAVLVTTLLALYEHVDAGTAGLCMTSAMLFTMSMYFACRFGASLELELNAIERVAECMTIPEDDPTVVQSPACWVTNPSTAFLSVENLCVKYASRSEPVLKNVSFTLNMPERIAVVGRTGSGRSTLVNSILRFVNPASGRVVIGGIDISKIGVDELRSRIVSPPCDATLFSGTLRENVDPLHKHGDDDCLNALHSVNHTWESFTTLDIQVAPAGANFSLGERQLIVIARALLRRDSIVILDEATSSVDFAADAAIRATFCKEFNNSLLINGKLSTILDYDRVIVLNDGEVVEFDKPSNLIDRDGGVFREMCLNSESYAEMEAAILGKMDKDRQAR